MIFKFTLKPSSEETNKIMRSFQQLTIVVFTIAVLAHSIAQENSRTQSRFCIHSSLQHVLQRDIDFPFGDD